MVLLYSVLGIIALSFPVIVVSNRTYVAPAGRELEFLRIRVATWRSLLQKTQFLTARSICPTVDFPHIFEVKQPTQSTRIRMPRKLIRTLP